MKNTYAKQSTAQHAKHAYPSFVFGLVGGWRVPFSHFLAIFLFRSLALDFMAAPSVVTPSAAVAVAVGVGSRVTLTNLQARHDLNEQLAVVVSALAPGGVGGGAGGVSSSDRGVFRLDSTGELVKARWINVLLPCKMVVWSNTKVGSRSASSSTLRGTSRTSEEDSR